ncbi:uncharacterized protein LOC109797988 [Cajanus cajan]|uniref:uncharacterized protein LOC109797988 n=1 Tax=Cajanus cajan TaxID=3821 RepID=UPI00098DC1CA|nr:uncharacterized protein LOC109797988 [Cajanus cajan]
MGVLRILNVAPTQLHPNSWAQMQAFNNLCRCIGVTPSPWLFLHFYYTRPTDLAKWLSLNRVSDRQLFDSFTSSYKNFKAGFFRITIRPNGRRFFCDENNESLFPFYWTPTPRPYDILSREDLSPEEQLDLDLLLQLPRGLPTKRLINLIDSPRWDNDLIGIMVTSGGDEFSIRNLLANRTQQVRQSGMVGGSNSRVASIPRPVTDARVPPEAERRHRGHKGKKVHRSGHKRKEDKDRSERPKKLKQQTLPGSSQSSLVVPPTLMTRAFLSEGVSAEGLIRPDVISVQGREYLNNLDTASKWKYFCEVQARSLVLAHSLAMEPIRELAGMRNRAEEAEKATVEALSVNDGLVRKNRELSIELDKLRRINDTLRLDVQKVVAEGERQTVESEKAKADLVEFKQYAKDRIVTQHEAGFNQAIRQARFFGHFPENLV